MEKSVIFFLIEMMQESATDTHKMFCPLYSYCSHSDKKMIASKLCPKWRLPKCLNWLHQH